MEIRPLDHARNGTPSCCWRPTGRDAWEHTTPCGCPCHQHDWVAVRLDDVTALRHRVELTEEAWRLQQPERPRRFWPI